MIVISCCCCFDEPSSNDNDEKRYIIRLKTIIRLNNTEVFSINVTQYEPLLADIDFIIENRSLEDFSPEYRYYFLASPNRINYNIFLEVKYNFDTNYSWMRIEDSCHVLDNELDKQIQNTVQLVSPAINILNLTVNWTAVQWDYEYSWYPSEQ